jgi:hypothetical protein
VPRARDTIEAGVAWRPAELDEKGEIVIAAPYPYLARTVWGDAAGFRVEPGPRGLRVQAGWRGQGGVSTGTVIVNSSRAVLSASSGDDFEAAARRVALQTRDQLQAAKPP